MGRLLKYIFDGFDRSIIGTPDFSQNNQYTDMINIGNDIRYAMRRVNKRVNNDTKETRTAKSLKRKIKRKKH